MWLLSLLRSVGIGPSQQPTADHRLRVGELMANSGWRNCRTPLPPALGRPTATAAALAGLVHDPECWCAMSHKWPRYPGPLPAADDPARLPRSGTPAAGDPPIRCNHPEISRACCCGKGVQEVWPVASCCRTAPRALFSPRPCRCATAGGYTGAAGGGSSLEIHSCK